MNNFYKSFRISCDHWVLSKKKKKPAAKAELFLYVSARLRSPHSPAGRGRVKAKRSSRALIQVSRVDAPSAQHVVHFFLTRNRESVAQNDKGREYGTVGKIAKL